jgi:uncharacterized protein with von Willebrand factor type A (vWA) domain
MPFIVPQGQTGLSNALSSTGYLAGERLAAAAFLALRPRPSLFLEGEPRVGKTSLVQAVAQTFDATEGFSLETRSTRVARALAIPDPPQAMAALAQAEPYREEGTWLGQSLRRFLRGFGSGRAARSAAVVIASDGHDSGPAALLAQQVERLSRLAHRLVWATPQQGWPASQPLAPVLVASLRFVCAQLPGHSFDALRRLAEMVSR